MCDLKPLKLP